MVDEKKPGDLALCGRLLREARRYWPHLALVFLLQFLATPLALLNPLPLKIAVDNVLGGRPLTGPFETLLPASTGALLVAVAVAVVIIALLNELQTFGLWAFETWVGERLLLEFRGRLLRHLQRLSLRFHDTAGSADAIYRVQYDAWAVPKVAMHAIFPLLNSVIKLGAMIYVSAAIDLELALVALVIAPLLFLIANHYRKRLRRQWKIVKEEASGAMSVVQESLSAVRVVKAFGQEDREHERYLRQGQRNLRAQLKVVSSEAVFGVLVGLCTAGGTAAVLYVGASHVMDGSLTLGSLLLVMGYLGQMYGPLQGLGKKATAIQGALASGVRAYEILDRESEVEERSEARRLDRARGALRLDSVTFAYEPRQAVIREVSLDIPAGSRVGIAGTTGAGKTTLMSLLPRLYDPDEGRILLDGVDLRDYRVADLRRQFAIVLQEPILFSTTIEENIAYGRPDASHEQVAAAARAANAHDFIDKLSDGYETEVGDRGMKLSGGERQRISIARAFLTDAPILLLDEPTSSVDVGTESKIMEALERLMEGRTTLIIAHRLSTLESCDLRVQIEKGKITEVRRRGE